MSHKLQKLNSIQVLYGKLTAISIWFSYNCRSYVTWAKVSKSMSDHLGISDAECLNIELKIEDLISNYSRVHCIHLHTNPLWKVMNTHTPSYGLISISFIRKLLLSSESSCYLKIFSRFKITCKKKIWSDQSFIRKWYIAKQSFEHEMKVKSNRLFRVNCHRYLLRDLDFAKNDGRECVPFYYLFRFLFV